MRLNKRQLRIALRNSGHVLSIIAIQFTIPDPLFSMSPLQNDNASTRSEANSKWPLFLLGNTEQGAAFAGNKNDIIIREKFHHTFITRKKEGFRQSLQFY